MSQKWTFTTRPLYFEFISNLYNKTPFREHLTNLFCAPFFIIYYYERYQTAPHFKHIVLLKQNLQLPFFLTRKKAIILRQDLYTFQGPILDLVPQKYFKQAIFCILWSKNVVSDQSTFHVANLPPTTPTLERKC